MATLGGGGWINTGASAQWQKKDRNREAKPGPPVCSFQRLLRTALGREITGGASIRLADWKKIKILFLDDNVKELRPWEWKVVPSTLATKVLAVITGHHHRLSFLR